MDAKKKLSIFWNQAATWGLIIGVVYSLMLYIDFQLMLKEKGNVVYMLTQFAVSIYLIYKAIIVYRDKLDGAKFEYIQGVAFSIVSMGFAGVIYGVGYYVMFNHIAHDYMISITTNIAHLAEVSETEIAQLIETTNYTYGNLFRCVMTLSTTLSFTGGLVGVIISLFTRRYATVVDSKGSETENNEQNQN